MREQRVALELLDHRDNPVVPAHPQVVALRHVVGEHHPGPGPDPGQDRQQHAALQRLGLVHDHERVVQRAAPDMGQRQHLEHVPAQHLVDHLLGGHRGERVVDRLGPRVHLVRLGTGQVAKLLTAHRVQRAEHHDLPVLAPVHHRFEARAQRQGRLARAGPAPQRHDADLGVKQQFERDPLLRAPAAQAERLPVAADQAHRLVRQHPAERAAATDSPGGQHQARVTWQVPGSRAVERPGLIQLLDVGGGHRELGHAGPPGVGRDLGPVLLGGQPERGGLHPQRQVLADQDHVLALGGQAAGDGEDAGVVVPEPEARREHLGVAVIQLNPDGAVGVPDGQVIIEAAIGDSQVVQVPKRLASEEPQFGMMTLSLQFGDHHDGQDHAVFREPADGARVSEQHAGVQDVGPPLPARCAGTVGVGAGCALPRGAAGRRTGHSFSPGHRDGAALRLPDG